MSRSPRSTERPNLPEPEAFGLSTTRVQHFDRPVGQYFFDRLTHQPIFWIVYLSGLFLLIYVSTESLVASFFILFFAWLLPLFVLAALLMLVDALWRRLQSDYPRYRDYQRAIEQHKIALAEWLRTQKDWWQSLSGYTFEAEIGRVFGKRGYTVKRVGGAGDQGVDLLLAKDGVTIVVQCKAHNKPIGPGAVRDLYGTLLHHQYREAWLVSSCGFTKGAAAFAANKPIRLIGVDELALTRLDNPWLWRAREGPSTPGSQAIPGSRAQLRQAGRGWHLYRASYAFILSWAHIGQGQGYP